MSSYATLLSRANVSNGNNKRATQASSLARIYAGLLSHIGRVPISHNNDAVRFSVFRISQESIISGAPAKGFGVNQKEIYVQYRMSLERKELRRGVEFFLSFFFPVFSFWVLTYRVTFRIRYGSSSTGLPCINSQVCWISKHEDGWNVNGKEKPCEPVGKCKLPYSEADRHSGPP